MAPSMSAQDRVDEAAGGLNPNLRSPRPWDERRADSQANAIVAIAQLLEYQNNILDRIADVLQGRP